MGDPIADRELRDLLVETHTMTREIHKAVYGNGRPGLIQDVAVLQQDMVRRQDEAKELRENVTSKDRRGALRSAAVSAIVIVAAGILKALFGIPLP